jgi:hypothetical protein
MPLISHSQSIEGTSGLMNIPSAVMKTDGTFILGANYLPAAITPSEINYNTGNYFFNLTFLPFLECTYRETLLRFDGNHNQDRSFDIRVQVIKESRFLPAIVAGGNDLLSSTPGKGSRYYNTIYGVATKHFNLKNNEIGFTFGYGSGGIRKENLNGLFGGITLVPAFLPTAKIMAEYDTKVFNAGAEVLFFRHFYLLAMAYDLKYLAGGFAYRIYLKDKPAN